MDNDPTVSKAPDTTGAPQAPSPTPAAQPATSAPSRQTDQAASAEPRTPRDHSEPREPRQPRAPREPRDPDAPRPERQQRAPREPRALSSEGGAESGAASSSSGPSGSGESGQGGEGGQGSAQGGANRPRRRRGKRGGKRHRPVGQGPKTQESDGAEGPDNSNEGGEVGSNSGARSGGSRSGSPSRSGSGGQRSNTPRASQKRSDDSSGSGDNDGADSDSKSEGGARRSGGGQQRRRPQAPRQPKAEDGADKDSSSKSTGNQDADGAADQAASGEGESGDKPATPRKRRRRRGKGGGTGGSGAVAKTADSGETTDAKPEERRSLSSTELAAAGATRLAARKLREEQRKSRGRGRRPRRLTDAEALKLKGSPKTMLIHEHEDRTQIALLEEDQLIEHYVSRRGQRGTMVGNVYMGKVQNVIVGMEAAFVDFGRGRNGILYANEITYQDEDFEGEIPRIEKALKPGQKILVQVTKDPIGTKGARLTTQVALAGRYLVLAPDQQAAGVSRRLSDRERMRLRKILKELDPPSQHGVIIRTAADGASHEAIAADLGALLKQWQDISSKTNGSKAPAALYEEPELIMRVVRDIFADDFEKVVCDTRAVFDEIRGYLKDAAPDLVDKVSLHEGRLPLFEEYRVAEQLHKSLERKVWLPSGGSLVFDRSEAMSVVDVNTGKFTGKGGNLEDTVFKNNCEAAEEIARQLRLRDIGGIIIIDFIDMIDTKNQREVLKTLKQALSRDKTKSQVFEVSNLGLVEMTRKRVSEGLIEAFSEPCPNCDGRGLVINHSMD